MKVSELKELLNTRYEDNDNLLVSLWDKGTIADMLENIHQESGAYTLPPNREDLLKDAEKMIIALDDEFYSIESGSSIYATIGDAVELAIPDVFGKGE